MINGLARPGSSSTQVIGHTGRAVIAGQTPG
jgi:hypothetical protein